MAKVEPKQVIPAELPQEVTEFKALPSMIVWLDTAIRIASDSPGEIEKESNISRQSWYRWLDTPGFEDWYYEEYKKKRRRWLPTLDAMGMKHAAKGDYNFWRDMNKKSGESLDVKVESNVQVNVLNAVQDQKSKYGI